MSSNETIKDRETKKIMMIEHVAFATVVNDIDPKCYKYFSANNGNEAMEELKDMSFRAKEALRLAIDSLVTGNSDSANAVIGLEQEVDEYDVKCNKLHIQRLTKGNCEPAASTVFTDMVHNLERVADHSTNLAYIVLQGYMKDK